MRATQVEIENNAIAKEYKELLKISYQTLSSSDKKLIRKAFDLSVEAHNGQRRKSGEAYVFHPIAVAKIVASEIGLDAMYSSTVSLLGLPTYLLSTPCDLKKVSSNGSIEYKKSTSRLILFTRPSFQAHTFGEM